MKDTDTNTPHSRCYWVEPGRFLAGTYPGERDPGAARAKLAAILDAGVRTFISLMEPDETNYRGEPFTDYRPIADEMAAERGSTLTYEQFPVRDRSIPSPGVMEQVLEAVRTALHGGGALYLHCWGGHGRTGIAVGCYLVQQGRATTDNVVEVIRHLRKDVADTWDSPDTHEQVEFIRSYSA